jgi:hypothetical protein
MGNSGCCLLICTRKAKLLEITLNSQLFFANIKPLVATCNDNFFVYKGFVDLIGNSFYSMFYFLIGQNYILAHGFLLLGLKRYFKYEEGILEEL